MCKRYIQISGPSGIGKTTLSKDLPGYMGMEDELHFISSSMSDLIPDTKDVSHLDMLSKDPKELYMDDVRLLNLRSKLYRSYIDNGEGYITDRGYLDLATYFFLKQSKHLADCEIEAFLNICLNMLFKHCSRLIVLAYTPKNIDWSVEDNSKRITSKYFQMQVYHTMEFILKLWGFRVFHSYEHVLYGYLVNPNNHHIEVLITDHTDYDYRLKLCGKFIKTNGNEDDDLSSNNENTSPVSSYGYMPIYPSYNNTLAHKWIGI